MNLRDESLLVLEHRGAILDTAREVSDLLREHQIRGAVIGGIAVVLNGHLRTTRDVDVWIADKLDEFANILRDDGAIYEPVLRELTLNGVPIHLIPADLVQPEPQHLTEIDGIITIGLSDLINMKLHNGLSDLSRAQDAADVIGLIRHHRLHKDFAAQLDKEHRADFRKLLFAASAMKLIGVESSETKPRCSTQELNENFETTNPTTLGFTSSLLISAMIAILLGRYVLVPLLARYGVAGWGIFLGFPIFFIFYNVFAGTLNTNKYTFDVNKRRIIVDNRWFLFFSRRSAEYSFDDIKEVKMRTTESSDAVILLHSGRKFSVKTTGDFQRVSALCDRIALVTGKSRLVPGWWK